MNRSSLFDSLYNSFSQQKVIVNPIDREKGMMYILNTIIKCSVKEMKKQIDQSSFSFLDSTVLLPTIAVALCSLLVFLRK